MKLERFLSLHSNTTLKLIIFNLCTYSHINIDKDTHIKTHTLSGPNLYLVALSTMYLYLKISIMYYCVHVV